MFAQIYDCPICGDVWRCVEMVEMIDTDRDEVWHEPICSCGRSVREKYVEEGGKRIPVLHALTDDEIDEDTKFVAGNGLDE